MPLRCTPPSLLGSDRGRPLVRGQQGCEHLWGRPRPGHLVPLGTRAGEGQSRQRGEASGLRRAAAEWTVSGTSVTKAGPGQLWVTGLLRGHREREVAATPADGGAGPPGLSRGDAHGLAGRGDGQGPGKGVARAGQAPGDRWHVPRRLTRLALLHLGLDKMANGRLCQVSR